MTRGTSLPWRSALRSPIRLTVLDSANHGRLGRCQAKIPLSPDVQICRATSVWLARPCFPVGVTSHAVCDPEMAQGERTRIWDHHANDKETRQGSVASPLLANIHLHTLRLRPLPLWPKLACYLSTVVGINEAALALSFEWCARACGAHAAINWS